MYYNIVLLRDISLPEIDALCEKLVSFFGFTESDKNTLLKEIVQFQKTLINGQRELEKLINQQSKDKKKKLAWADIFKLYDTFGFPFELTKELAQEKGFPIDEEWFQAELEKQKDRSRKWSKDMFTKGTDRSAYIQWLPSTQFIWYDALESNKSTLLKDFLVNDQRVLVFDKTPFYAEWWGQTWDRGVIILDSGEQVQVVDVKKYEGIYLHIVK